MGTFLADQPWVARLLVFCQLGLFLVALLRFAKLFFRLYTHRRASISQQQIATGAADGGYALSHRAPPEPIHAPEPLGPAETEFLYLCEKCSIDIESTKRAGWLTFLLTLIAAAFRVSMAGKIDCDALLSFCLLQESIRVSQLLVAGLSVSTLIYLGSSFFERKISKRRADWKYFFDRSRAQPAVRNPLID
jgi:hypothetical protein